MWCNFQFPNAVPYVLQGAALVAVRTHQTFLNIIAHCKRTPNINNYIQRLRTATRAAPCNKSAMTDNSFPSRMLGAKPVHGIQALFSWHSSLILTAFKPYSHGIQALFSWHPSIVLMAFKPCSQGFQALFSGLPSLVLTGAKPCSCEVEAMFVRGCNNVLNVVIL